jgi:hypothetical protein
MVWLVFKNHFNETGSFTKKVQIQFGFGSEPINSKKFLNLFYHEFSSFYIIDPSTSITG